MELYIHIPFCVRKCNYCDFLSFPCGQGRQAEMAEYVDALCRELDSLAEQYGKERFTTAFIGGGTPSILPAELMERVLQAAGRLMKKAPGEYTIECNPGTVDAQKLALYRKYGINRISFGLQSVNDGELKMLGRIHNYEQFLESYKEARMAGFDNINIDLISAIPGQTVASWERTLRTAAELNPEHISAYSLIIEPGTPFWNIYGDGQDDGSDASESNQKTNESPLPDEDSEREMYRRAVEILQEYGYHRYEISNYSKAERESKHNLGYWTGEEYLGAGLGASSYVKADADRENECTMLRYKNTEDMAEYIAEYAAGTDASGKNPSDNDASGNVNHYEEEYLNRDDLMSEYMILHLRLTNGLVMEDFRQKFGTGIMDRYGDTVNKYIAEGFLKTADGRLMLTENGLNVSNIIMAEFI